MHIAQGDTTDFVKVDLLGEPEHASWFAVLASHPWLLVAATLVVLLAVMLARTALARLPAADHPARFHADARIEPPQYRDVLGRPRLTNPFERRAMVEQVALASLVIIIFGEMLAGWTATPPQVIVAVSVFIVANGGVSVWLGRRGVLWRGALAEFVTIGSINVMMVTAYGVATRPFDLQFDIRNGLFFVTRLTLIVTLHDRYRSLRRWREEGAAARGPAAQGLRVVPTS